MKKPIDRMLDSVEWEKVEWPEKPEPGMLYATHRGVLKISDMQIECVVLNDGQRLFTEEGMKKFFGPDGMFFNPERGNPAASVSEGE